jgi:hypothetical protein
MAVEGRERGSAFFGGDGEEGSGALVNLFAVALRALDLAFLVFVQSEGDFKRFLAFFAIIFVARHGDLRTLPRSGVLSKRIRLGDGGVKAGA